MPNRQAIGPALTTVESVTELIGNTPMVRLSHQGQAQLAPIYVKLEQLNPSGSIRDRYIAEILQREGYIASWDVQEAEVGKTLTLNLKYGPSRERSIAGLRRVSKPGLRVYAKSTSLPRVLGGLGIAILSTSSGLLTDRQAAKKGVGGEVLAYVW